MRRFNDFDIFPFWIDRMLESDWRREMRKFLGEDRKCRKHNCEKECKKEDCNYLRIADNCDDWNKTIQFYSPTFKLGEDGTYTYTTTIPKGVKPGDIEIDAAAGTFFLKYEAKSEDGNSSWSSASSETLPKDLDVDSMKAVLKGGVLTITAKQVVKEEPKVEEEDETEYEIEIGK